MFIGNTKALHLMRNLLTLQEIPHILLVGPSGHGKSTLAKMAHPTEVQAQAIETVQDLKAILAKNPKILFIDEIHALKPKLQESLFQVMDEGRTTIIGATTKEHTLLLPLRNRFLTITLQSYTNEELTIMASLYLNDHDYEREVPIVIANNSRGTPRELVALCNLFIKFKYHTKQQFLQLLNQLDIFPGGLKRTEFNILKTLQQGPASLSSLSARLLLEPDLISQEHEIFLIKKGLIRRNKNGREITLQGMQYMANAENY